MRILSFLLLGIAFIVIISAISDVSAATNNSEPKSSSYTISYFDKTVGGDVLKNPDISKNVPNSTLSSQIVNMSKNGSVILKFGKGNPKVLIFAGIHGNEGASNIATLKLIESMKNKKIKGSVYIIPFTIPKSTAKNSRYWYKGSKKYDPNRVANIPGTPGYKIVKFAKKNGIKYIIEAHSGGDFYKYKRGLIYANRYPTNKKEAQWIKYIKKNANPKISYTSVPPKGYLRAYARANKITAITFEVEKDIGPISHWSDVELKMMTSALRYFKLF